MTGSLQCIFMVSLSALPSLKYLRMMAAGFAAPAYAGCCGIVWSFAATSVTKPPGKTEEICRQQGESQRQLWLDVVLLQRCSSRLTLMFHAGSSSMLSVSVNPSRAKKHTTTSQ